MKKILFILGMLFLLMSCEKEDLNTFEGTSWSRPNSTLEFYESTFTSMTLSNSGEVLVSSSGSYSVEKGVATLMFNQSVYAVHSAYINQSVLLLTNLSSNKSYQYDRKSSNR